MTEALTPHPDASRSQSQTFAAAEVLHPRSAVVAVTACPRRMVMAAVALACAVVVTGAIKAWQVLLALTTWAARHRRLR